MRLTRVYKRASPARAGRTQLAGDVEFDDSRFPPEVLWFEVGDRHAVDLSETGDPWLVALAPLAVTLGESLTLPVPVDEALLENVTELVEVWHRWYRRPVIEIDCGTFHRDRPAGARVGSFFSGGVDSFFTLLRHEEGAERRARVRIDDLLFVWGFDIPLSNPAAFSRAREKLERAAGEVGKELVDVATNLRHTAWLRTDWGALSHGCALGAVGLALEKRFSRVLIPSTHVYERLFPFGSHPITDVLFSTSTTRFSHDGAGFSRVEKTEFLTHWPVAMRNLRVCWNSRSDHNCEACAKCYRTMATLYLLDALDACETFDAAHFDVDAVGKIFLADANDRTFFQEIASLAVERGHPGLARAVRHSLRRSRRLRVLLRMAESLERCRFLWRFAEPLERRLLAGSLV